MRYASLAVAVFGAIIGGMSAYEQHLQFGQHIHFGVWWLTVLWSIVGLIGGILVLFRWKYAPWMLLLTTIGGVYPNFIIWEGAGSFFFVSALMGFSANRETSTENA